MAVRVTNTTKSNYSIEKETQFADFSVFIPEQSKFIEPVVTTILTMILEGNPDLITYPNEVPRMVKPEQQNYSFRFPIPEEPGKIVDHASKQTRILKELHNPTEKE